MAPKSHTSHDCRQQAARGVTSHLHQQRASQDSHSHQQPILQMLLVFQRYFDEQVWDNPVLGMWVHR